MLRISLTLALAKTEEVKSPNNRSANKHFQNWAEDNMKNRPRSDLDYKRKGSNQREKRFIKRLMRTKERREYADESEKKGQITIFNIGDL